MRLGQKAQGNSPTLFQKVQQSGARLFKKYGDILVKAGNIGMTAGTIVGVIAPGFAPEIVALSELAGGAGRGAQALGNALEKSHNHHNRLM
jgi:hypothetical protein